ncbi:MAG: hypothetical protein H6Q26_2579 [Bacteroidetes bacterium]|nr:hypothetical protein [Bacteroidota bacterium]
MEIGTHFSNAEEGSLFLKQLLSICAPYKLESDIDPGKEIRSGHWVIPVGRV